MSQNFLPAYHFESNKLTPEWCYAAIQDKWYSSNVRSLLQDKNIEEIIEYSTGNIDMAPYKRMYKSIKKDFKTKYPNLKGNPNADEDMQFVRYPAIPPKLNSVVALVQKIPFEVTCTAVDGLAYEKKQEDVEFIKNKPVLEADLQPLADQMRIGKVDLGETKYSDVPYSDSPYGLDLTQPEELSVFVDLIYKLGGEAAMEEVLQSLYDLKNVKMIKLQEIKDQFKFGVSCNRVFESSLTGLPDFEYVYPNNVFTEPSELPDYSDNTARFIPSRVGAVELINIFPKEIGSNEVLNEIINGKEFGYCACNKFDPQPQFDKNGFKVELVFCAIKSVDGIGIVSNPKKSPYMYMTDIDDVKATGSIWAQNTYCAWWLKNTKHFFGIHKLGYATRTKGMESYQGFPINIYRSQALSPVELCIDENKKAQVASIKLMYALIMSLPAGKYIDINFLQGAVSQLKETWGDETMNQLIELLFERNIGIGSSVEFEDKPNMGNFKPFYEIPGGLKAEVGGYFQTLQQADAKISQFTGANDQLTGQSANPEGLVGMQKLLINSSINALHWITEAIENQYQKMFSAWAWGVKQAIEAGGKSREAIKNIIGSKQTNLIDRLKEIPLHSMGVKFTIFQRVEEGAKLEMRIERLDQQGIFTLGDHYMLDSIPNPKRKYAYASAKEIQFRKRYDKEQQQRIAAQQEAIRMQGKNQVDAENAKAEGKIKDTYAKGTVSANIAQLIAQSGMSELQLEGMIKKQLQSERNAAQLDKSIKTLEVKQDLKQQEAFST